MVRFDIRQTMKTSILRQPIWFKKWNDSWQWYEFNQPCRMVWKEGLVDQNSFLVKLTTSNSNKSPFQSLRDGEQMSFWHTGFWTTKLGGSPSRRRVPRTSASSPGKWSDFVEDSTLVWFFRKDGRMRVDFNQRRSRCSPIVPPQLGLWELRKAACSVVVDHFWRGGVGCLTWEWKHGVSFESGSPKLKIKVSPFFYFLGFIRFGEDLLSTFSKSGCVLFSLFWLGVWPTSQKRVWGLSLVLWFGSQPVASFCQISFVIQPKQDHLWTWILKNLFFLKIYEVIFSICDVPLPPIWTEFSNLWQRFLKLWTWFWKKWCIFGLMTGIFRIGRSPGKKWEGILNDYR